MKVGTDTVDISDPCAMAAALTKVRIRLSAGQLRETVRIDGEEVTFQRANLTDLKNMIAEYQWGCTCAAATTIKDDVISAGLKRKINIVFNVIGRQFKSNGNTTRTLADFIRDFFKISRCF